MASDTLERKLCAVVSADVFGYSQLMADDEAQTIRTVGRYREEVKLLVGQHRGRLVDFTGDNFLAEFPTATDAVVCSVEIHRVVEARNAGLPGSRRMHFRIGVHLGEVAAEGERLFGDGVNIAARLEGIAQPGGVCVSAAVRDQMKKNDSLSFDDLGPQELKNIPDPVHVFCLRPAVAVETASSVKRASTRPGTASVVLAAFGLAALALAAFLSLERPVLRRALPASFRLDVLGNGQLSNASYPPLAISPDGRSVAYAANTGTTTQVFLRSLDRFEAQPLAGTEGAVSPFFSPDGSWLGFFARGAVHKIRTTGGAPLQICETSNFSFPSASWGTDGIIRYSRGINVSGGLLQVSADGGKPELLTRPDFANGERWHGLPQRLPDGAVLFTVATQEGHRASLLSPDADESRILEELGPAVAARWLPSGQIVFGQPGRLMAASWRPGDETARAPRSVVDGVHTSRLDLPFFAISENGSLVYAPGGHVRTVPVLVDLEGRTTPIADDPGSFQHPRFSPDDQQLAVDITWRGRSDIYVYDLLRGARRRLTHTGSNIDPLWAADGRSIVFRSTRRDSEGQDMYRVAADGDGEPEPVLVGEKDKIPGSWARDGSLLAYTDISFDTRAMSVGILDLTAGTSEPLVSSPYNVGWPVFSPTGDRLAYVSDESGRSEVWARPFPAPGAATQVSLDGGLEPLWSPDGRELYFRRGMDFFAVSLDGEDGLHPGRPRELFTGRFDRSPTGHQHYAVDSTGRRFAAIALGQAPDPEILHMVLDWGAELGQLTAEGN
jgi:class 3 adenylate cyclase/Tol biopolymer transport system component